MSSPNTRQAAEPAPEEDIIKMLPPDIQRALTDVEPEERKAIVSAFNALALRSEYYEGPLPPSHMLREYEEILPGAADRIIGMAERQAEHRQDIEKVVIASKSRSETLGVVFAGLIGLSAIVGGVFLIAIGRGIEGLAAIITAIGSLVGTFVYGTRSEKKELAEKRQQRDGK